MLRLLLCLSLTVQGIRMVHQRPPADLPTHDLIPTPTCSRSTFAGSQHLASTTAKSAKTANEATPNRTDVAVGGKRNSGQQELALCYTSRQPPMN